MFNFSQTSLFSHEQALFNASNKHVDVLSEGTHLIRKILEKYSLWRTNQCDLSSIKQLITILSSLLHLYCRNLTDDWSASELVQRRKLTLNGLMRYAIYFICAREKVGNGDSVTMFHHSLIYYYYQFRFIILKISYLFRMVTQ